MSYITEFKKAETSNIDPMKILLRHTSINYNYYDSIILHEIFSVISFRVKGEIDERGLNLSLIFTNGREAREAYRRIIQGRNSHATSVSISEFDCTWPTELAQKIDQYAQYLYDFDRPIAL